MKQARSGSSTGMKKAKSLDVLTNFVGVSPVWYATLLAAEIVVYAHNEYVENNVMDKYFDMHNKMILVLVDTVANALCLI